MYRWLLLFYQFCFCETHFTTYQRFVADQSAISPFLGGQRNVSVHIHSSFFEHVSLHIYSSLLTRLFTHLKEMSLSTFKICVQRHFKDLSLNTLRSLYTYTHLSFNTSLYTKTRLFQHVTHTFILWTRYTHIHLLNTSLFTHIHPPNMSLSTQYPSIHLRNTL